MRMWVASRDMWSMWSWLFSSCRNNEATFLHTHRSFVYYYHNWHWCHDVEKYFFNKFWVSYAHWGQETLLGPGRAPAPAKKEAPMTKKVPVCDCNEERQECTTCNRGFLTVTLLGQQPKFKEIPVRTYTVAVCQCGEHKDKCEVCNSGFLDRALQGLPPHFKTITEDSPLFQFTAVGQNQNKGRYGFQNLWGRSVSLDFFYITMVMCW